MAVLKKGDKLPNFKVETEPKNRFPTDEMPKQAK